MTAPSSAQTSEPHSYKPIRLLVIRFSSFGDIVQALGVPGAFKKKYPEAQVDWLVRQDMAPLVNHHPHIDQAIAFPRSAGLMGLIRLSLELSRKPYTHVYDAHTNLRSRVVCLILFLSRFGRKSASFHFARRSKDRLKRWLLFRWGFRSMPFPFRGALSFLKPLEKWGVDSSLPERSVFFTSDETHQKVQKELEDFQPFIALVPSAAWPMKRWPLSHWKRLIEILPDSRFVVFGGPEDQFCEELKAVAPDRVRNVAGKFSLDESSAALDLAQLVVSADTGLLHVADMSAKPAIALMGPTAFGHPSRVSSKVLEVDLPCRPCSKDGRGKCTQKIYQRCMVEITPEAVATAARSMNRT